MKNSISKLPVLLLTACSPAASVSVAVSRTGEPAALKTGYSPYSISIVTKYEEELAFNNPAVLISENFVIGIRITSVLTSAQIEFINQNIHYVMTPILSHASRAAIQGPQLILYRSILGTWQGFSQFDWNHIASHESMFCHDNDERIITHWNSWLMDTGDMVQTEYVI